MTGMDYDHMVLALISTTGCSLEKAQATARQHLGIGPEPTPAEQRDARVLEKAEQAEIVKLFRAHGFAVYNLSQARASKQTPGLPDLWVMHRRFPQAAWVECKRQVGGVQSAAQIDFQENCKAAQVQYVLGDRHAAKEWLKARGFDV